MGLFGRSWSNNSHSIRAFGSSKQTFRLHTPHRLSATPRALHTSMALFSPHAHTKPHPSFHLRSSFAGELYGPLIRGRGSSNYPAMKDPRELESSRGGLYEITRPSFCGGQIKKKERVGRITEEHCTGAPRSNGPQKILDETNQNRPQKPLVRPCSREGPAPGRHFPTNAAHRDRGNNFAGPMNHMQSMVTGASQNGPDS